MTLGMIWHGWIHQEAPSIQRSIAEHEERVDHRKGLLPLCQTRCMTAGPWPLPRLRLFSLSARVVKKSSDRKKMEFPRAKEEHPFREKLRTLR